MSHRGGTFGTSLSRLRRNGYLDEGATDLSANANGLSVVGRVEASPGAEQIRDIWVTQLGPSAGGRIVKVLADRGEQWSTRIQLAGRLGMSSEGGTFGNILSRVHRNGILE